MDKLNEFLSTIWRNNITGIYGKLIYDSRFTPIDFINQVKVSRNWETIEDRKCYKFLFDEVENMVSRLHLTENTMKYTIYFGNRNGVNIEYYRSNDIMSISSVLILTNNFISVVIIADSINVLIQDAMPGMSEASKELLKKLNAD